jgi:transposase
MTQKFYAKEVLPKHIEKIKELEARWGRRILLQEDGDSSHGNKSKNNVCALLKRDADLQILIHPAQSPDLNPIEAVWQILKQRLRGRKWRTVTEFKADIQQVWDSITLAQIRRRIREMPWRCRKVIELNRDRVRSSLW